MTLRPTVQQQPRPLSPYRVRLPPQLQSSLFPDSAVRSQRCLHCFVLPDTNWRSRRCTTDSPKSDRWCGCDQSSVATLECAISFGHHRVRVPPQHPIWPGSGVHCAVRGYRLCHRGQHKAHQLGRYASRPIRQCTQTQMTRPLRLRPHWNEGPAYLRYLQRFVPNTTLRATRPSQQPD